MTTTVERQPTGRLWPHLTEWRRRGTSTAAGSGVEGWWIADDGDLWWPGYDVIDSDGDTVTWYRSEDAAAAFIDGVRLGWARWGKVERGRQ